MQRPDRVPLEKPSAFALAGSAPNVLAAAYAFRLIATCLPAAILSFTETTHCNSRQGSAWEECSVKDSVAEGLRESWKEQGSRPCRHEALEDEVGFAGQSTGGMVCIRCGTQMQAASVK